MTDPQVMAAGYCRIKLLLTLSACVRVIAAKQSVVFVGVCVCYNYSKTSTDSNASISVRLDIALPCCIRTDILIKA